MYFRPFKKFFWWFVGMLLICFIGISNVFAEETKTGLGYLNNSTVIISNNKGADVNLSRNSSNSVNMDIKTIIFQSNYAFQKNVVYEYEVELVNQYLNNINSVRITSGNNICSFISLQGMNSSYLKIRFTCPDSVNYLTFSLSNLNDTSITNGYNIRWNTIYLWSITDTINLGPIINNDNSNTNNIINNNNQNTQDIIDNNDENTQKIIDENKKNFETCKDKKPNYVKSLKGSLFYNSNKVSFQSNDLSILVYEVEEFDTYTFKFLNYNRLRVFLSDILYEQSQIPFNVDGYLVINNDSPTINEQYSINVNKKYIYMYLSGDSNSIGEIEFNSSGQVCTNKLDETKDAINNLDDTLKDDNTSDAENKASEFFSSFNTETFGLTSIITAPLNLIRSVLSSTCTDLQLPLPYLDNKKLTLPCMSTIYSQFFGSFFTLYQTITYGIIAYWVCVRIFNQVKDFKNPEHDEIEVMDL